MPRQTLSFARFMHPRVYSPDNLIQLVALTGKSRGQSLLPESRRQWKPGAGRFEISPQSHPDERPAAPSIADDLRRPAGQVDRVGGIRYLPHEWASAFASHLRQPQIFAEETRTPSGVVPREHVSRPGTGRKRAILRAFLSPGTLATCDAPRPYRRRRRLRTVRSIGQMPPPGTTGRARAWRIRATA